MTDRILLTLEEVSELTGWSLYSLQRDCQAGRIDHVHRKNRRYMTRGQVDALIEAHTRRTTQTDALAELRARHAQRQRRRCT